MNDIRLHEADLLGKPDNSVTKSQIDNGVAVAIRNKFYNALARDGYHPAHGRDGSAPRVDRKAVRQGNMEQAVYTYIPKTSSPEYNSDITALFTGYLLGMAHAVGAGKDDVCIQDGKVHFNNEEIEQRIYAVLEQRMFASQTNYCTSTLNPEIFYDRLKEAIGVGAGTVPRFQIRNGSGYDIKTVTPNPTLHGDVRYDYLLAGYLFGAGEVAHRVGQATYPVKLRMDKYGPEAHVADDKDLKGIMNLISGRITLSEGKGR